MPRARSASPWRGSASWLLASPQTARARSSGTAASLRTAPSAQGAKTSTSCAWIASGATRLPFALEAIVEELSWPEQEILGRAGTARPLRDLADGRTDEPLADAVFLCPQRDGGVLIGAAMTLSLYDPPEGADLPAKSPDARSTQPRASRVSASVTPGPACVRRRQMACPSWGRSTRSTACTSTAATPR